MNIVLDTNVLVSAFWNADSKPAAIVNAVASGKMALCYDCRILEEYTQVLKRPKFTLPAWQIEWLMESIIKSGVSVVPEPLPNLEFADERDRKFLEVANYCFAPFVTENSRHDPSGPLVMTVADFYAEYCGDQTHTKELRERIRYGSEDAGKPARQLGRQSGRAAQSARLADILKREKEAHLHGGVYHRVQIDLTYNSNHIEGSRLTQEQTRHIFETNTIGLTDETVNVDDIVETANHFRCIDQMIEDSNHSLSEAWIKRMHQILKNGTTESRQSWFAVGEYKKLPNEVGGCPTTPPEEVADRMKALVRTYNALPEKTLEDLLRFHVDFERIHPFQDGNGRVGRLILFKECLRNGIVPFIITDEMKLYYYRGLQEWEAEKGYLTDTCLAAQDQFREILDFFRIAYKRDAE